MLFRIGVENNVEGRSLAWALEHPGCFAYGESSAAAQANMPQAISDYAAWIAEHNQGESWVTPLAIELSLEETWQVYDVNDDYERVDQGYSVNAWFLYDWKPLTAQEVRRGLQLLSWSRADLLSLAGDLNSDTLEAEYSGERWSIAGILKHIGGAEWWYMDRLGMAFARQDVPTDPFVRLEVVRRHLAGILPGLAGSKQVTGTDAEFWSPRKVLRRAIWHERDHLAHIQKLLAFA